MVECWDVTLESYFMHLASNSSIRFTSQPFSLQKNMQKHLTARLARQLNNSIWLGKNLNPVSKQLGDLRLSDCWGCWMLVPGVFHPFSSLRFLDVFGSGRKTYTIRILYVYTYRYVYIHMYVHIRCSSCFCWYYSVITVYKIAPIWFGWKVWLHPGKDNGNLSLGSVPNRYLFWYRFKKCAQQRWIRSCLDN